MSKRQTRASSLKASAGREGPAERGFECPRVWESSMGYETQYKLVVRRGPVIADMPEEAWKDIKKVIRRQKVYEGSATCGQVMRGELEPCKWYDHQSDMAKVSKMFPSVLFVLHGSGEESGDLWREYFLDGKMQKCTVELRYPKFDIAKMATVHVKP